MEEPPGKGIDMDLDIVKEVVRYFILKFMMLIYQKAIQTLYMQQLLADLDLLQALMVEMAEYIKVPMVERPGYEKTVVLGMNGL